MSIIVDIKEARDAREAGIGATDTMASANGITPWHKNATGGERGKVRNASEARTAVLEGNAYTGAEFARAARIDWTVSLRDLFLADGQPMTGWKAIVRDTDGRQYAAVRDTYKPIQNVTAIETMDAFVRGGYGTFETAGSLWNGKTVYVSIRVADDYEVVEGDVVQSYIVLANSHDGTGACKAYRTDKRVVCNNTLRAARREGDNLWTVRHIGDVDRAMRNAREEYLALCDRSKRTRDLYKAMARTPIVADADMRAFIRDCLAPAKLSDAKTAEADSIFEMIGADMERATSETERQKAARERQIDEIMRLADGGAGTDIPGVKGTLWGAYNAVTEYATHLYPTRGTERDQSVMAGAAGKMLDRAIDVASARVGAMA